jgi:hypothetical protein
MRADAWALVVQVPGVSRRHSTAHGLAMERDVARSDGHRRPRTVDESVRSQLGRQHVQIDAQECRRLVRRDVEAILTLRPENGDVVILLPGWDDDSTGAFGESGVARWAQVPLQEFQFVQIPRIYCRMPGDAPLKPYSLTTLTEDEWGAKANMRATDKHGDD